MPCWNSTGDGGKGGGGKPGGGPGPGGGGGGGNRVFMRTNPPDEDGGLKNTSL